jgi:hypothetical protein
VRDRRELANTFFCEDLVHLPKRRKARHPERNLVDRIEVHLRRAAARQHDLVVVPRIAAQENKVCRT